MRRALRIPALHYLVLGAVLFAARSTVLERWSGLEGGPSMQPRIVITAAQRDEIQRQFREKLGRIPSPDEERLLVDRLVDDEILYREALARDLDRDNVVVRDRVVQSMRLLADDPRMDEETLYHEGLQIGLDRRDLVVRRHLAMTMRLLAAAPARAEALSDDDLREELQRSGDRFRLPPTTSMTHVFVSGARGLAPAEAAARRLLDTLRATRLDPADAPARGDPFPMGYRLAQRTDWDLDGLFGVGFASALAQVPLESWSGPLRSGYGVHLVWVHGRNPGGIPALDSIRSRLAERASQERGERRLHDWLTERRKAYVVHIEEPRDPAALLQPVAVPLQALPLPQPAVFVGD